jgi:hypothetical protein
VTRRVDWRPIIAFVLLVGLLGFYGYQHWTAKPASPLIGRARVLDGDSLEISRTRIRLLGIDAPEWSKHASTQKGRRGRAVRRRRRNCNIISAVGN